MYELVAVMNGQTCPNCRRCVALMRTKLFFASSTTFWLAANSPNWIGDARISTRPMREPDGRPISMASAFPDHSTSVESMTTRRTNGAFEDADRNESISAFAILC